MAALRDLCPLWGICGCSEGFVSALRDLWLLWGIFGCSEGLVAALRDLWLLWGICGCSEGFVAALRDLSVTPQNIRKINYWPVPRRLYYSYKFVVGPIYKWVMWTSSSIRTIIVTALLVWRLHVLTFLSLFVSVIECLSMFDYFQPLYWIKFLCGLVHGERWIRKVPI